MDIDKLVIKASVKQWEKYWKVFDRMWECQLHKHLHAASNKKILYIFFIIFFQVQIIIK